MVWRKGFKSADHTFLFVAGGVDANIVGGGGECETDLTLLEFKSQDYSTTKRVYRIKVQETSSFLVNAVVDFAVLPHDCSSSTDTTSFDYSGFYLLLLFSNGKFRFKDLPLLHSSSTPVPASCCQESETRFYQHLPPSIFMHSLIPPLKSAGFLTCSSLVYSVSALKLARVPTEFTMPMFSSKTSNYQFPSSMVKNSLLDTSDMFVSAHADNKIVFWGKEKSRDFQSSVVSPWACLFSIDLSKWINITSLKSICLNFFQYDDCDAGGNLLICAGPHVLVFGFLGDCGQTNTKNTAVSTSKPSNIILESDAGGEYGEGEKLMQTGVEESEGGLDDEAVENQGNYEHEGSEEAIKMKGIDVIENMDSMMSEVDDILLDVLQDSKNVKELMSKNTIAKDIIPNASSSSEGRKSLQLDRHRHPHLKQSIFPKRIWNLSVGSLAGQPTIKSDSNEPKYREDVVIERSGLNVKVDGSGWYPMIQVVHLDVVSSCCYAPWLGL